MATMRACTLALCVLLAASTAACEAAGHFPTNAPRHHPPYHSGQAQPSSANGKGAGAVAAGAAGHASERGLNGHFSSDGHQLSATSDRDTPAGSLSQAQAARLESNERELNKCRERHSDVNRRAEQCEAAHAQLTSKHQQCTRDLATASQTINQLTNAMAVLQADVTTCKFNLTSIQEQLATERGLVMALDSNNTALEATNAELRRNLTAAQDELDKVNNRSAREQLGSLVHTLAGHLSYGIWTLLLAGTATSAVFCPLIIMWRASSAQSQRWRGTHIQVMRADRCSREAAQEAASVVEQVLQSREFTVGGSTPRLSTWRVLIALVAHAFQGRKQFVLIAVGSPVNNRNSLCTRDSADHWAVLLLQLAAEWCGLRCAAFLSTAQGEQHIHAFDASNNLDWVNAGKLDSLGTEGAHRFFGSAASGEQTFYQHSSY